MVSYRNFYVFESRFDCCCFHAYGLGGFALVYAVLVPPLVLIVFVGIGALEADYTFFAREIFLSPNDFVVETHH